MKLNSHASGAGPGFAIVVFLNLQSPSHEHHSMASLFARIYLRWRRRTCFIS